MKTHDFHELLAAIDQIKAMQIDNTSIANLHHAYRVATGFDLGLNMDRERQWYEWAKFGHTVEDLRLVIEYLKREIKMFKRNPGSLKLSNLIGRPDLFDEDLSLAKKWLKLQARIPKVDHGRESVLKATGRTTTKDTPPRTPEQIMRADEALKQFRAFKETL